MKISDIAIYVVTSVLVSNISISVLFLISKPLEQRMKMSQLDVLLKVFLFFLFFIAPFFVQNLLLWETYEYGGFYNGDDGIDEIWRFEEYTLGKTTPYGRHWIFTLILLIWVIGVFAFGIYHYKKEKKIFKLLEENSYKAQTSEVAIITKEICKKSEINQDIPIRISNIVDIPFTTGIFRPIIFLPEMKIENNNLQFIIKHELIHCKYHDCLYRKILFWIEIIYWFNPMFHKFAEYFIDINEMACDERTLFDCNFKEVTDYAKLLVGMEFQEEGLKNVAFLTGHTESHLERRLKNMKRGKRGMKRLTLAATSFFVLSICSMTTFAASAGISELQDGIAQAVYTGTKEDNSGNTLIETTDMVDMVEIKSEEAVAKIEPRGVTIVDEDIPGGQMIALGTLNLSSGDIISISVSADPSSANFRAGYMDSDGRRTYVTSSSGRIIHSFTMSKADSYKVFFENRGSGSMHIYGSITVLYD